MTVDRGGLRISLERKCETWNGVVYRICSFSQMRRTWRGLPLVSCLTFSERGIGSWRSSRTPNV